MLCHSIWRDDICSTCRFVNGRKIVNYKLATFELVWLGGGSAKGKLRFKVFDETASWQNGLAPTYLHLCKSKK